METANSVLLSPGTYFLDDCVKSALVDVLNKRKPYHLDIFENKNREHSGQVTVMSRHMPFKQ
jgi:hypothetical protein